MLRKEKDENKPQESFLDRMAQRLGNAANAATVFGAPVERGEVTVIPVAKAVYGFGGGGGTKDGDEGSGGGGGVSVTPLGYIEIRDDEACYKPIRDWAVLIPVIAAAGVLTFVTAQGIARLFRR